MRPSPSGVLQSRRIVLRGRVQAVGFRPFIYRHALTHRLDGWVRNISGRVEVHVQGEAAAIDRFIATLVEAAPAISDPAIDSVVAAAAIAAEGFSILGSHADAAVDIHLPADLYTCPACCAELDDPADRRYRYPFINCTQCGPRYTIIESLPYDRDRTSMSAFALCAACAAEYTDVLDRRYHAEPVACPACGPALNFDGGDGQACTGNEASLQACIAALGRGRVVAVKGIGGYHLVCDARNPAAVLRLRSNKPRPHKPLAVMFTEQMLQHYFEPTATELELLRSPARPLVLVERQRLPEDVAPLCAGISPGLRAVGAMLPYSPLHRLLLQDFGAPLVMTSANISGEPVLTSGQDVIRRLAHVADACLHHDRGIVRPADDPVYRVIAGIPRPLRLGRGVAPLELELPLRLPQPVLAVGCHMKNTIALAFDDRVVISPHIGEMDSVRSMQVFERTVTDLQTLYQVEAGALVTDAHPGYGTTRWAGQQRLPVYPVYHHHAHAATAWYEAVAQQPALEQLLVFTWDGVGLGADGTLWGGEALLGSPGNWRRAARFRSFRLPGGERAGREPWRSAAGLCWEVGIECPLPQAQSELLHGFWAQARNAPLTTAAGRLFDAAAALTGVCHTASFEGQGPMWLEAVAAHDAEPIPMPVDEQEGCLVADWAPLLHGLLDASRSVEARAGCVHASLAQSLLEQALAVRARSGVSTVGLSGGVFQNRLLSERAISLLQAGGFTVILPAVIPVNDAGISFGQIIEYAYQR